MENSLFDYWPIMAIEDDLLLSRWGDVTVVYEALLPEVFTLSGAQYEAYHQSLIKALRVLPPYTLFHKQDWFVESSYRADFENTDPGFLTQASERHFHERPYLQHHCYVMITKKPDDRKPATSLFSALTRKTIVPAQTLSPQLAADFLDHCSQLQQILHDSSFIRLRRLKGEELWGSAKRAGLLERYISLNPKADKPILRDISFKEGVKIGEVSLQLYTLCDMDHLPSLCGPRMNYDPYTTDKTKFSTGFAAPLGQLLNCNHLYNQYIFLEEVPRVLKQLERKRLRLQSLSAYSRQNALSEQSIALFLNEALSGQHLPVRVHYNLMLWSEEKEREGELKNQVGSALAAMGAVPRREVAGAPQIFWAGIPGGEAELPENETVLTFLEPACCLLNLETTFRSSISPIGLRLGERLSGRPLQVDLSDEPLKEGIIKNRNKFILGPSGSGKSFFTNHLVRSYYEKGSHIVLVDVGHSYKGLCGLLKGYYFTYEDDLPLKFNPFYVGNGSVADSDKRESLKALLVVLWKKDPQDFNRLEYVALSAALKHYYNYVQQNGCFPCFNSFYEYVQTEFAVILQQDCVKEQDFDLKNFLYVLRPFYRGGEYDYLLNGEENLDLLGERFIVFELDRIKDHPILLPVVTIIIMEVFISKLYQLKGVRKMILIEEAWKAIAREGMAEYIRYLFKTVRKHFGEAVVVTQEVEDIISSSIVKETIIHNSDCKILLDQDSYQNRFEQIESLLGLTEKERALVFSLNKANDPKRKYKEVFISLGGRVSKVYRTEVSLEEYLTYTTEETEKVRVLHYARRYGDLQKGIEALAEEIRLGKN